jgi:hypothetical protein
VLVISHDAALAGAQMLLLNLLHQWKKRRPFAVKVICVGSGELRKSLMRVFPHWYWRIFAKAERDDALAEFLNGSPRVIYSSTVVNGSLLAELRPKMSGRRRKLLSGSLATPSCAAPKGGSKETRGGTAQQRRRRPTERSPV